MINSHKLKCVSKLPRQSFGRNLKLLQSGSLNRRLLIYFLDNDFINKSLDDLPGLFDPFLAERDQHKAKLDKVLNTLHALKTDLEQKENKRRDFVEKIESAKIRIEAQEQEISDLNSAAEDMRKQERQDMGLDKIFQTIIFIHEFSTPSCHFR